jgi:hypothetical protein
MMMSIKVTRNLDGFDMIENIPDSEEFKTKNEAMGMLNE